MPFCRECGKGVEEDWVTCPFCSQPIGPPAARVAEISDSVVMGDVNVNDSAAVSEAIILASKCPKCNSLAKAQVACSKCNSTAFCDVCKEEVQTEINQLVQPGGGIDKSRICIDCVKSYPKCRCCLTYYNPMDDDERNGIEIEPTYIDLQGQEHNISDTIYVKIPKEQWYNNEIICWSCFRGIESAPYILFFGTSNTIFSKK